VKFTAREFLINLMDNRKIAFVFPGQGSQSIGMGHALSQYYPTAKEIFQQANDILGFPLSQIAWEGPEECLNDTINTQPALFTHSIAVLQIIHSLDLDLVPSFVAGHSMGELSALVAAGSLSFADGLRLVKTRGELMKRAGEISQGGMAAVLGLDIPIIETQCVQASTSTEIVQVANDNCPGQVVISGANAALDRVQPLLEQVGARRVIRLAISIAAHSPYMSTSQEDFNQSVASTLVRDPYIPVISNVTAQPMLRADEIKIDLQNQLTHRVRWSESIQYLISSGVSEFIEIGNGSVLNGLIKRIDRNVIASTLGTVEDFQRFRNQ
jgi:[acyl-carrier-protein] S-malonyltransferase